MVIGQLVRSLLDAEDVLVEAAWQISLALDWYRNGDRFIFHQDEHHDQFRYRLGSGVAQSIQ